MAGHNAGFLHGGKGGASEAGFAAGAITFLPSQTGAGSGGRNGGGTLGFYLRRFHVAILEVWACVSSAPFFSVIPHVCHLVAAWWWPPYVRAALNFLINGAFFLCHWAAAYLTLAPRGNLFTTDFTFLAVLLIFLQLTVYHVRRFCRFFGTLTLFPTRAAPPRVAFKVLVLCARCCDQLLAAVRKQMVEPLHGAGAGGLLVSSCALMATYFAGRVAKFLRVHVSAHHRGQQKAFLRMLPPQKDFVQTHEALSRGFSEALHVSAVHYTWLSIFFTLARLSSFAIGPSLVAALLGYTGIFLCGALGDFCKAVDFLKGVSGPLRTLRGEFTAPGWGPTTDLFYDADTAVDPPSHKWNPKKRRAPRATSPAHDSGLGTAPIGTQQRAAMPTCVVAVSRAAGSITGGASCTTETLTPTITCAGAALALLCDHFNSSSPTLHTGSLRLSPRGSFLHELLDAVVTAVFPRCDGEPRLLRLFFEGCYSHVALHCAGWYEFMPLEAARRGAAPALHITTGHVVAVKEAFPFGRCVEELPRAAWATVLQMQPGNATVATPPPAPTPATEAASDAQTAQVASPATQPGAQPASGLILMDDGENGGPAPTVRQQTPREKLIDVIYEQGHRLIGMLPPGDSSTRVRRGLPNVSGSLCYLTSSCLMLASSRLGDELVHYYDAHHLQIFNSDFKPRLAVSGEGGFSENEKALVLVIFGAAMKAVRLTEGNDIRIGASNLLHLARNLLMRTDASTERHKSSEEALQAALICRNPPFLSATRTSILTCNSCHHTKPLPSDPCNMLEVHPKTWGGATLGDLLRRAATEAILSECENCCATNTKTKHPSTQTVTVSGLADTLFIRCHNGLFNKSGPAMLNTDVCVLISRSLAAEDIEPSNKSTYALIAFCAYINNNHWVTWARQPEAGGTFSDFLKYDDGEVPTRAPWDTSVHGAIFPAQTANYYLYERVPDNYISECVALDMEIREKPLPAAAKETAALYGGGGGGGGGGSGGFFGNIPQRTPLAPFFSLETPFDSAMASYLTKGGLSATAAEASGWVALALQCARGRSMELCDRGALAELAIRSDFAEGKRLLLLSMLSRRTPAQPAPRAIPQQSPTSPPASVPATTPATSAAAAQGTARAQGSAPAQAGCCPCSKASTCATNRCACRVAGKMCVQHCTRGVQCTNRLLTETLPLTPQGPPPPPPPPPPQPPPPAPPRDWAMAGGASPRGAGAQPPPKRTRDDTADTEGPSSLVPTPGGGAAPVPGLKGGSFAATTSKSVGRSPVLALRHDKLTLFINFLTGKKKYTVFADPAATIGDVKALICEASDVPINQQRLFHVNTYYNDNGLALSNTPIRNGSSLTVILRLLGGALTLPRVPLPPRPRGFDARSQSTPLLLHAGLLPKENVAWRPAHFVPRATYGVAGVERAPNVWQWDVAASMQVYCDAQFPSSLAFAARVWRALSTLLSGDSDLVLLGRAASAAVAGTTLSGPIRFEISYSKTSSFLAAEENVANAFPEGTTARADLSGLQNAPDAAPTLGIRKTCSDVTARENDVAVTFSFRPRAPSTSPAAICDALYGQPYLNVRANFSGGLFHGFCAANNLPPTVSAHALLHCVCGETSRVSYDPATWLELDGAPVKHVHPFVAAYAIREFLSVVARQECAAAPTESPPPWDATWALPPGNKNAIATWCLRRVTLQNELLSLMPHFSQCNTLRNFD